MKLRCIRQRQRQGDWPPSRHTHIPICMYTLINLPTGIPFSLLPYEHQITVAQSTFTLPLIPAACCDHPVVEWRGVVATKVQYVQFAIVASRLSLTLQIPNPIPSIHPSIHSSTHHKIMITRPTHFFKKKIKTKTIRTLMHMRM